MKKHCSVTVLYNPNFIEISDFLNELIQAGYFLFLIDNSEKKIEKEFDIFINHSNVTYISFKQNKGLAFAQNKGLKEAISRNFETVSLFDQDSFIRSANYIRLVEEFTNSKYDIMCPLVRSKNNPLKIEESLKLNFIGWPIPLIIDESKTLHRADVVIASGLTCNLKVFEEVGFFKEDYFIDYLDIEWCLRARNKEKKIVVNSSFTLLHSIGIDQENYIIFNPQTHAPERTFYQFRNNLSLFKESHIPIVYCIHELLANLVNLIFKLIFKKNRTKHLFFFWNAIKLSLRFK